MNRIRYSMLLCLLFTLPLALFSQEMGAGPVKIMLQGEAAVNTKGLEFSPTFYEDGIVFISTNSAGLKKLTDTRLKLPAMSILRSRRNADGGLSAPEPFARELSSLYHEGPVCFDRTAETVYFSRNATVKGREKLAKDGSQKMRLYASKKSGEAWEEPVALPFNANEFDDCHPAISIDGDKLFFASNRPGGLGGMDIYVSYRVGDSWSEPVNLGAGVNSKGNEAFPFIHADNTLYYASDGLGGEGGFDLYYVIPEGSAWTKPINMGPPFNTKGDDFGLIVDLNKINGYLASSGMGGAGADDIFSFHTENGNLDDYLLQNARVPERDLDLKVTVVDKTKGTPIQDAALQILQHNGSQVIGRDQDGNLITVQTIDGQDVMKAMAPDQGINGTTNNKGQYTTDLKPGNYVIIASKKGYQTRQLQLPVSKPGNEVTIQLEKVAVSSNKIEWNASVFNNLTNAPMAGTTVILTNPGKKTQDTVVADANGVVSYYLDRNTRYHVDLVQGGRVIASTEIQTQDGESMRQSISVAPLLPGSVIELPNIYYNFNDATLRPDSRKDLSLVKALMDQHKNITVELASHTDSRGTEKYNQELSQRRAEGVVNYLISMGIPRERLKPVGYGESQPRNGCRDGVTCSEAEHSRNRRTEIRIETGIQGASLVYIDGQVVNPPGNSAGDPAIVEKQGEKPAPKPPADGGKPVKTVKSEEKLQFFVIAGSFLMQDRANAQIQALVNAGFGSAEIVQFPNSPYFSISVGKFANRTDAENLEKKLENKKIAAFIRANPAKS